MEIAASVGTELALSGISRIINQLASHVGGDVTREEMEHLDVFVRYKIEALIREAKSDDLEKSAPLLEKLQAAALEVEDLLDHYEYKKKEKQVGSSSSSFNPINKLKRMFKEIFRPFLRKSRLRIGLENLLKFVEQVENLHPFIMSRTVTTQPQSNYHIAPKTSTLSTPFYGRADQCEMIIKLLVDESHPHLNSRTKNVPIIAIRGWGGAGKTTTAQHIYNEHRIENYFDLSMWVHVTLAFDERSLIRETIESAEGKACDPISSLDTLQKKLKESVSKKKFLLVLDDVWEKDTARLDLLLAPLNQVGEKGSRIILTTRMLKVAEDLHAKPIIHLDDLEDEDCWSILKHYAFDGNEEILENDPELKNVGNQIIIKAKRSPLALKVVGSSLQNKRSAKEWDKILQQKDISKDTMNLLLFSYQRLPLHLQRCFAYCSLFPKGYKFYFNPHAYQPHLIYLWIAQGFIENTNELMLEEAGQKYIEELVSYSFFEKGPGYYSIMHDLLHDLAEEVSKKHCHRIEHHDSLHIPATCIHLSLCITEKLVNTSQSNILAISEVFNLRNLRSLIVLGYDKSIFESKKIIFQNITKLRALYVDDNRMEVLSDPHVDKLRHLRYLHVRYYSKIPVSLVKLYQLQFFILITDREDYNAHLSANILPQGFGNLTNLQNLQIYGTYGSKLDYLCYNSKMISIGKLKLLKKLENFHIDGFNGMKSLRDLSIVGGSLSILNLENVKCKEEAEEAMLNQKKNIDTLIFVWSSTLSGIDTCEEVLEGLEPHWNLESLEINGYQGVKLPKWMVKENRLPCLESLRLESCTSLKVVPFLPPRLKQLKVQNCHELMQLPPLTNLSPTLTGLAIKDCPNLMLTSTFNKSSGLCDLSVLTNLSCLRLKGIPNLQLQVLANLSPTVTTLSVEYCPNLPLPSTFDKSSSLCDSSTLTNLQFLWFKGIRNLQVLTILSHTVTNLEIEDCPKLASVENLQRCTSLYKLSIVRCPMLKREEASVVEGVVEGDTANRLPHVEHIETDDLLLVLELVQQQAFSSIIHLSITDCAAAALPSLEMLSSLEDLCINDCPDVVSLPNLPVSLQYLGIAGCPKMKEKYEDGGPLRNTISHISEIRIC